MSGSVSVALQGLLVAQQGFEVASQNIANVNTPGYSRQQVELSARSAPELGVQITSINRVVDQFAMQQYWSSTASFKTTEAFAQMTGQVDDLLANPITSISAAMGEFFSALQTGVDDPASIPGRELILSQMDALTRRFSEVDRQLRGLNTSVNTQLDSAVSELNSMATQVAELNKKIQLADSRGDAANELKDQRDELVLALSAKAGVSVQTGTGSTDINLYIGNGQPLVIGGNASQVQARQGDPDINNIEIDLVVGDKRIKISDQISSGEIGGMLRVKEEVLIPTWNELGRLAIVFADTMNEQQRKGLDLDGNLGSNLFNDPANLGEVRASSANNTDLATTSNVVIRDTTLLKASDYQVKFNKDGDFTVTRLSDGKIFNKADFATRSAAPGAPVYQDMTLDQNASGGTLRLNIDGVDISLASASGGPFTDRDLMLVQPVRFGAEELEMQLTSGNELAFASPVRSTPAEDNVGLAKVDEVNVTDPLQFGLPGQTGSLNPPARILFTDANTYSVYDMTDPNNPTVISAGNTYTDGAAITLNGYEVVLRGKAATGDKFDFTYNTDASGDNRNALQLSNLQQEKLVDGSSYQDNYGRMIERIGTKASVANIDLQATETVMRNAETVRNGISGVSLDEEAANIIKFQQQYQAAAQVINAARSLFDTLLSASGG
ncbi:flagellar hook-associated protein FlgK [Motiliproteus sediminis]|uniref:flagellar hook-associated protein FlgK n=1 Tax=Motiliproteus sediminis TaxID=1468178 RepID=UPI001AEF7F08|nr:flagellar hook-associated protein FlgK [Motiliproteus sediminis]